MKVFSISKFKIQDIRSFTKNFGGLVVETPCFTAWGTGSIFDQGIKIPDIRQYGQKFKKKERKRKISMKLHPF